MNQVIDAVEKGNAALMNRDIDGAVESFEYAASQGDTYGMYQLGLCLMYGKDQKEDGFKWISEAANQGNVEAWIKLADFFRFGHVVEKDWSRAFAMYQDLFERLDADVDQVPEVWMRMAECYFYGIGVDTDYGKAATYFKHTEALFRELNEEDLMIKAQRLGQRAQERVK